ncbi:MAG: alpha/beta hydrolase fold protein [Sphingomonas bacterium]|uniref:alpha/beta fold hydrolase n=1 Tax=Sphingomonas bacterium TaxID=1895847 RepID=UPI0026184E58|nr:alpha/beta fold hydrolase [Sphingomonas bacterium]MDB5695029.1 alpha/beta hydrolase fold protein [Sphingomonas bacterium]
MTNNSDPEIGNFIDVGAIRTNYHDLGSGDPIVLIHGSGPGVTAWANWRFTLPELAKTHRVIALDMLGFGYTDPAPDGNYTQKSWQAHLRGFLDALELDKVSLIGNSFGGAMSLALAAAAPDRVDKILLMGSGGLEFPITPALATVWSYRPSVENMREVMNVFAYNRALLNEDLIEMRYRASIRPGISEAFAQMFARDQQAKALDMTTPEDRIAALSHQTLIVHGREDQVVPLEHALRLHSLIKRSQLHVFGECGHWTQIEQRARFNQLAISFFAE